MRRQTYAVTTRLLGILAATPGLTLAELHEALYGVAPRCRVFDGRYSALDTRGIRALIYRYNAGLVRNAPPGRIVHSESRPFRYRRQGV